MKQRRFSATLIITALALTSLILTALPLAGTAASRLERQPSEPLVQFPGTTANVSTALRSSPVMFIENVGQFDERARFQVRGGMGIMWLAEDAIWVTVLEKPSSPQPPSPNLGEEGAILPSPRFGRGAGGEGQPRKGVNLRLTFPGANPHPRIEPFNRLDTHVSYFIGSDPDQWHPDVPVWGGVRYVDMYPGVNLEATSQDGRWSWQVVTDDEVALSQVRLRVEGADSLALDETGYLHLNTIVGEFTLPLMQVVTAAGTPLALVTAQPTLAGNEIHVPLTVPSFTPQFPTLQDNPDDLLYSTFLGGSGADSGLAIAVDTDGSAYVVGNTRSFDLPTTPGAFDTTYNPVDDVFVTKLNALGSSLVYSTFLGGSGDETYAWGFGIAVDAGGAAYVTGLTSSDFPTTSGAFDTSYNGEADAFVTKLNRAGSGLIYSTFLGGSNEDRSYSIDVDSSGAAYVAGMTISSDFPITAGAFDSSCGTDGNCNDDGTYRYHDAFVAKLDDTGGTLVYSTFLGGNSLDEGNSVAVGTGGTAYVTGGTYSSDFPATAGAFDTSLDGNYDAFVVRMNASGTGLDYATFLGGSSGDGSNGIAVDESGAAYVTGGTSSSDFPTTAGAFDTSLNGGLDAFVVKVNATGTALVYATFLGGSWCNYVDADYSESIAVDGTGNAYVTGKTISSDFPSTPGAFDTSYNGPCYDDAFVVKVNAVGTGLAYATFLGGSNNERGYAISVDRAGSAYVTGWTWSSDFPTTPGAFDPSYNGGDYPGDAFVAKLAMGGGPGPTLTKPPVVLVHGWAGLGPETRHCSEGISRPWPGVPNAFGDMATWLQNDGFDVWIAHLDTGPSGTPLLEDNAWGPGCLKDQIAYVKQQTGAQQVIIIAHSMGGLVSRAYIEGFAYQDDVQALFTLGSPHSGLPFNWLKYLVGSSKVDCTAQQALCEMTETRMEDWNQTYGSISHGVTPPYYLTGGDKSDSVPGWILKSCGVDPNDGYIGTRTAQALKDGSTAIQSNVKARYQTHETHSSSWVLGKPSYFQPPSGQDHSQSYQCIQNVLLGTSNPCAGPSAAALSAQAAPSLTGYTSDVFGHLNTGETAEHTLQVDADGASLFYLSWVTGTLGFTLTNPVGTVIDPAYAAANTDVVTYTTSPGSEMTPPFAAYAFTTTVPGLYTATITADDVDINGTDYLLFGAMETTRTLSVALDSDHYQIGDTTVLTATLEGAGGGITGATVQATFSRSDAVTDTLTLTDQGDGTYQGIYVIPNAPGYLHLCVTAEGSDAGTQFNRQVDRLLTVASQAVQLTGTFADRADDADSNGRYETLTVDVEVLAAVGGDFTFSADLVNGGDQFVAHVITQTALITGTQSVPLRFDGELIQDGGSDGPFTVTNLLISDPQNAGIPSVMADDVWTTAAYDHTQFGRISGDMNGDCIVTVVDIMLVASRWGTNIGDIRYDAAYDLDDSGNIDIVDIMIVATHWREGCE